MLDVFTDPAVFNALHPVVQIVVLLLGAAIVAGATWLIYQLLCLLGSLF